MSPCLERMRARLGECSVIKGNVPHTSRRMKEVREALGYQISSCPGNSPQLDPIEKVWKHLKAGIKKRSDETKKPAGVSRVAIERRSTGHLSTN